MKAWKAKHIGFVAAVSMAGVAETASAGIPVFDLMNFATNVAQNVQLTKIQKTLTRQDSGTINYYSHNIDQSTTHIDTITTNINTTLTNNTEINVDLDFTTIINKGTGGEIIPVPRAVTRLLEELHAPGDSDTYAAKFRDAATYYAQLGGEEPDAASPGFDGSSARKAANNALVKIIDIEQTRLSDEATTLKDLSELNQKVQGHARQLQVANAIAGSQANQLMQMRSMMLASESARAAEAQATADKDARAIATGAHLREGLGKAIRATSKPLPAF